MANYYTSFSEYPADAVPSDWTVRYDTANSTWAVRTKTAPEDSAVLEHTSTADANRLLSWNVLDADAGRENTEILARVRSSYNSAIGSTQVAVGLRMAGATSAEAAGYSLQLRYHSSNTYFKEVRIVRYDSGFTSAPTGGSSTLNYADVEPNVWYWLRFRANGQTLKGKYWRDGDPEPAAWTLETSDTNSYDANGWVGVYTYANSGTRDFDAFAAATGGDTAEIIAPPQFFVFGHADQQWVSDTHAYFTGERDQQWAVNVPLTLYGGPDQQWSLPIYSGPLLRDIDRQWSLPIYTSAAYRTIDQRWATQAYSLFSRELDQRWAAQAYHGYRGAFDQQWATLLGQTYRANLDQDWALNAYSRQGYTALDQAWALTAGRLRHAALDQQWQTRVYGLARGHLGQQWQLDAYRGLKGTLDQDWALKTIGAALKRRLDQQWRNPVYAYAYGSLDSQWTNPVYAVHQANLDRQWALTAYTLYQRSVEQQWTLERFVQALAYLDQQYLLDSAITLTAYAMNRDTRAHSEYRNYPFNSLAREASRLLGAQPDGIYLLDGGDDAGTAIAASLITGKMDFGSSLLKRPTDAYLGIEGGPVKLTVTADTGPRSYLLTPAAAPRSTKADLARAVKTRYVSLKLENQVGGDLQVDTLELRAEPTGRRA